MEAFSQYQPLFAEAINGGRIGVCKWIEAGTTIDTALPEIGNLTDDKKEWRAVIVRYTITAWPPLNRMHATHMIS